MRISRLGWNIQQYFRRVELVKPTAFATTPNLNDGVVYTDEHIDFLNRAFAGGIFAPGPTQVMVGTDNEPDLFAYNFPMLQRGTGRTLTMNGVAVGTQVTGTEFTARFIRFAKRVKALWPTAPIIGPDHYHYDGWTNWWDSMSEYSDQGRWYMDDFLATVRAESGVRLLDAWDFHWYPQRVFNGTYAWALERSAHGRPKAESSAGVTTCLRRRPRLHPPRRSRIPSTWGAPVRARLRWVSRRAVPRSSQAASCAGERTPSWGTTPERPSPFRAASLPRTACRFVSST